MGERSNKRLDSQLSIPDVPDYFDDDPDRVLKRTMTGKAGKQMRNISGFYVGQGLHKDTSFANIRQKQEQENVPGYVDTLDMTGKQIIDGLIRDNASHYQKKYAFEKGTYH